MEKAGSVYGQEEIFCRKSGITKGVNVESNKNVFLAVKYY